MPLTDLTLPLKKLSDDQLRQIAELIYATWPKPGKDVEYRQRQIGQIAESYSGPGELSPTATLVLDRDRVVAVAINETRTIGTPEGDFTILGLGKVCSDPNRRGEGLGARVVRGAFKQVDEGPFPFALFQTTTQVRPFYERLGACVVPNPVINSQHPDADAHPFHDEVVMRYPSGTGWPAGQIDLRGPGY